MGSEHNEVLEALGALRVKASQSRLGHTTTLSSQELGSAMYGLRRMNSSSQQVQGALEFLADKIKR